MDMCSIAFISQLEGLLKAGRISQADIDNACRRVLEAKYKLGLFDDPYRFCEPKRLKTDIYNVEHRKAAREMAAETFVLLKNEECRMKNEETSFGGQRESQCAAPVLPLKKQGKIALIGPLADNRSNMV